jgi:hypothetical protein
MAIDARSTQAAFIADPLCPVGARHVIFREDRVDVATAPLDGVIELVTQRAVAAPHSHGHGEFEPLALEAGVRKRRAHLERNGRARAK